MATLSCVSPDRTAGGSELCVGTSGSEGAAARDSAVAQECPSSRPIHVNPGPTETGGCLQPARVKKQAELLKDITALHTQEDLLLYVERYHPQLDTINLVTVLYRLARIYNNTQAHEQRAVWRAALHGSTAFQLLISIIHDHLIHLQAIFNHQATDVSQLKASASGVLPTAEFIHSPRKAQCLSNLMWSLDKLEVMTAEPGNGETGEMTSETASSALACDLAMAAGPLVILTLADFTSQGLGNLVWNFAKMPAPPALVLTALMTRSVQLLESLTPNDVPDTQALSHTLRSIAHIRSRPTTAVDGQPAWQEAVTCFLLQAALQCIRALAIGTTEGNGPKAAMQHNKQAPSAQTMVSIASSYSSVLGSACGVQAPVSTLFQLIHKHVLARLQSDLSDAPGPPPLLSGALSEQSLSRVVSSLGVAGLLSSDLLQAVLDVAGLRLRRANTMITHDNMMGYAPQELCVLLRACHMPGIQPWFFLHALSTRMSEVRDCTAAWAPPELMDLQRALRLHLEHMTTQGASTVNAHPPPTHPPAYHATAELLDTAVSSASAPLPGIPFGAARPRTLQSGLSLPVAGPARHQFNSACYATATAELLDTTASAPLPRLPAAAPATNPLQSVISLPTAGPTRIAFSNALSSMLHHSPPLDQPMPAGLGLGLGSGLGPAGTLDQLIPAGMQWGAQPVNALLHPSPVQPPVAFAARGIHPYRPPVGTTYNTGGAGLGLGPRPQGVRAAVHPPQQRVYLDGDNPADAPFSQQLWLVDQAGNLQQYTLAAPQAEETISALQHLMLAPQGGYLS